MGSRTRVLYIIGTLEVGGTETQLSQMVRRLDPARYHVEVGCLSRLGPVAEEISGAGIPVSLYGLRGLDRSPLRLIAAVARNLGGHLRRFRPDIVHTYLYHANLIGALAARLAGRPVVVTSRRGLGHFKDGKPHLQWAENLANLLSDGVMVNSRGVAADTMAREAWVRGKVRLIYNGIDPERFAAPARSRAAVRSEFGIPPEAPVIGCVANLIPYKGHADLIEAMAAVVAAAPSAHLVLVGRDQGVQSSLSERVHTLDLGGRVHFAGPRPDVADLLHAFDLFALASHEEGFPNVILEAMAAGLPIVATAVGGVPEVVADGQTGLLVPPREPEALGGALIRLLTDSALAAAVGRRGQERVQAQFSWSAALSELDRFYSELLAGRKR